MQENEPVYSPVSLESIRDMVTQYSLKMNRIAKFLEEKNAPEDTRIDTATEYLQFYIDQAAIGRLNNIAKAANFDHLGVFFGLEAKKNNKITCCFLGMDKENNVLDAHKKAITQANGVTDPILYGEEDWPPPYNPPGTGDNELTLNSTTTQIDQLLS